MSNKTLSKRGALQVTRDLDKIANAIQEHHEALGIPARVAFDYVQKTDRIADALERRAGLKPGQRELTAADVSDNGEVPQGVLSSDRFPAKNIGEEVPGPDVKDSDDDAIQGHFKQDQFHQLGDVYENREQGIDPTKVASLEDFHRLVAAASKLPTYTHKGYAGMTEHIRMMREAEQKVAETDALLEAMGATALLNQKGEALKEIKGFQDTIKKAIPKDMHVAGNHILTTSGKLAKVEAVIQVQMTADPNKQRADALAKIAAKFSQDIADEVAAILTAAEAVKEKAKLVWKSAEIEDKDLGKTAGILDLASRAIQAVLGGFKALAKIATGFVSLVTRNTSKIDRACDKVLADIAKLSKTASSHEDEEDEEKEEGTDKEASYNLFD